VTTVTTGLGQSPKQERSSIQFDLMRRQLRAMFKEPIGKPLPADFAELLKQLDEREDRRD